MSLFEHLAGHPAWAMGWPRHLSGELQLNNPQQGKCRSGLPVLINRSLSGWLSCPCVRLTLSGARKPSTNWLACQVTFCQDCAHSRAGLAVQNSLHLGPLQQAPYNLKSSVIVQIEMLAPGSAAHWVQEPGSSKSQRMSKDAPGSPWHIRQSLRALASPS